MTETNLAAEMEAFIRQVFEQNYEELRLDSGHSIAPDVKLTALNQVLLYWRTLRDVAQNVTDTEVRLSLPSQETPRGRDYTIEGVVDIVQDNERTVMYDIKTHSADYVRANIDVYEQQLNVYAYVWQELRKQPLDAMAIIATDYPESVRTALSHENEQELEYALRQWQPVVDIDYDARKVDQTIAEFGKVVDDIEDGRFTPPSLDRLKEILPGTRNIRFATHVCRNCDARFSCKPYREYAWLGNLGAADRSMSPYLDEAVRDSEQETWRSGNLDAAQSVADLRADFSSR